MSVKRKKVNDSAFSDSHSMNSHSVWVDDWRDRRETERERVSHFSVLFLLEKTIVCASSSLIEFLAPKFLRVFLSLLGIDWLHEREIPEERRGKFGCNRITIRKLWRNKRALKGFCCREEGENDKLIPQTMVLTMNPREEVPWSCVSWSMSLSESPEGVCHFISCLFSVLVSFNSCPASLLPFFSQLTWISHEEKVLCSVFTILVVVLSFFASSILGLLLDWSYCRVSVCEHLEPFLT
jgi:hypothetical protein